MGQYHYVVNLDKEEYLHPHAFGDGLKLLEFGASGCGTMTALALLLARDNGPGGGDMHSDDPLIGRWAGDRVIIVGDYGKPHPTREEIGESFLNISAAAREMLCEDSYVAEALADRAKYRAPYADNDMTAGDVRVAIKRRDAERKNG